MIKNDSKSFFLIASGNSDRVQHISSWINQKYPNAVIYTASDFTECTTKLSSVPTQILILDFSLPDARAGEMVELLLNDEKSRLAILGVGSKISSEKQSDAVAIGRLFYVDEINDFDSFQDAILKISNFAFHSEIREYQLRSLKAGEILIREGDTNKNIFIVRKGELTAYQNTETQGKKTLGNVYMGEFVGEMAYFIGENRVATVEAVSDCEVIEIPAKTFERVIYHRRSWVKNLFETLARRLMRKAEVQKGTKA